ncbi:HTH-type transcriptional repressor AllR [Burkholderiaceae bacterium]|nr:HTH-type transcriptional repressor AllR [Burkholderiaceae bacterium]
MANRKPTPTRDAQMGTQSLERAFGLLRAVASRASGARLSDLAASQQLNIATARRILLALIREGFVEQDGESRQYFIGPEAFVIGTLAGKRFGIRSVSQESLIRLANKSHDTVFLSVPVGMYCACVQRVEGTFPIRSHLLQEGDRHPLGVGAGSLAILATMSDEAVERCIESNAAVMTGVYKNFTADVLRALVRETRERGFAVNRGLVVSDSWGVGAAVVDASGQAVGALSIAAIKDRLKESRLEHLGQMLKAECAVVARQLGGGSR